MKTNSAQYYPSKQEIVRQSIWKGKRNIFVSNSQFLFRLLATVSALFLGFGLFIVLSNLLDGIAVETLRTDIFLLAWAVVLLLSFVVFVFMSLAASKNYPKFYYLDASKRIWIENSKGEFTKHDLDEFKRLELKRSYVQKLFGTGTISLINPEFDMRKATNEFEGYLDIEFVGDHKKAYEILNRYISDGEFVYADGHS